jgi:hypothetical protein
VIRTNESTCTNSNLTISTEGEWEKPISLSFDSSGVKTLQMELYAGEDIGGEPYQNLRLIINVRETS